MKKPSKKPARKSPSSTSAAMHIRLPARQLAFARRRAAAGGYASIDDYVAALVRSDQELEDLDREVARAQPFHVATTEQLQQKLAEGLASGAAEPMDASFWRGLRKRYPARRTAQRRRSRAPGRG